MFGTDRNQQDYKPPVVETVAPTPKYVTAKELDELRDGINTSFDEVANLFLELQGGIQNLNERLEIFNRRSGQKI